MTVSVPWLETTSREKVSSSEKAVVKPARVMPEFDPLKAFEYSAFGLKEARTTASGVECFACCHSMVATG